jgi:hypothetical protein
MPSEQHRATECQPYKTVACGINQKLSNIGNSSQDQRCDPCTAGTEQNATNHTRGICIDITSTTTAAAKHGGAYTTLAPDDGESLLHDDREASTSVKKNQSWIEILIAALCAFVIISLMGILIYCRGRKAAEKELVEGSATATNPREIEAPTGGGTVALSPVASFNNPAFESGIYLDVANGPQGKPKSKKGKSKSNVASANPGGVSGNVVTAAPKGAIVTLTTANGAKLGMKVEGEAGTQNGLQVKAVVPGGQAEQTGKIKERMVIQKINGKDIRKMTRQDATAIMKSGGETIKIKFMPAAAKADANNFYDAGVPQSKGQSAAKAGANNFSDAGMPQTKDGKFGGVAVPNATYNGSDLFEDDGLYDNESTVNTRGAGAESMMYDSAYPLGSGGADMVMYDTANPTNGGEMSTYGPVISNGANLYETAAAGAAIEANLYDAAAAGAVIEATLYDAAAGGEVSEDLYDNVAHYDIDSDASDLDI